MITEIVKDKDNNLLEISIYNLPESVMSDNNKQLNAIIEFKYSNGEYYGQPQFFPCLMSESEMQENMKFAKENIDKYKFVKNNLIDYVTDKNGEKVEIEIRNVDKPIIVAGKETNTIIELRYDADKNTTYGSPIYFPLPHLTEGEMIGQMQHVKDNIDKLKF